MDLDQLQECLGYSFQDRSLLEQALTHKSYGYELNPDLHLALRDNERLEFLGDAVLQLILSDLLVCSFPDYDEGNLTKTRAALVNEKSLSEMGLALGLPKLVRLGKGEQLTGGRDKASIVSDAFEALMGALYLDGGFDNARSIIKKLFSPLMQNAESPLFHSDFKSLLQEFAQGSEGVIPVYRILKSVGPDHARVFQVEVSLSGRVLAVASGASKKRAEQNAAKISLDQLKKMEQG